MHARIASSLSRQVQKWRRSWVKHRHVTPILRSIPADSTILEIGGGYSPRFTKATHRNVYHLDHCSTEELRRKYAADPAVAHLVGQIQPVDFVFVGTPIETLIPPGLKFDVIYGSHVLEHQVDLIGHWQSLERLVKPDGRVIEVVPDLRTCFDALRYPTVTSDVLTAHIARHRVHQGKQVFDGMSRELDKNLGHRMIDADYKCVRFRHDIRLAYQSMLEASQEGAIYRDTHAWAFTPESLRSLLIELRLLGLVSLVPASVTPSYGNQFCVVLRPGARTGTGLTDAERSHLEDERMALARLLRF
jgi:SAM-dependent methyltransferase